MAPDSLIEALRLSARRPENARSVASLMHAIDRFRRPRSESVLTAKALAAIRVPTTFILGSKDPYLSPHDARPSIARIADATVHEMAAGHGPWLVDPRRVAGLIADHQDFAESEFSTVAVGSEVAFGAADMDVGQGGPEC
jgi:pimeloyl-ACP methyl ester carboxylesterase